MLARPPSRTFKSHRDVLAFNQQRYENGVSTGEILPLTYPMLTWGAVLLVLYYLIPQVHSRVGRYITFLLSASWHLFLILNCKAYGAPAGFGIGIISAWGILWAAVVLVFNDPVNDWKRVKLEVVNVEGNGISKEAASSSGSQIRAHAEIRRLREQNSISARDANYYYQSSGRSSEKKIVYRWQPYPVWPLRERIEWSLDLLTNFRGVGWNWKIGGLPSRPIHVQCTLDEGEAKTGLDVKLSKAGIRRYDTYWPLVLHNVRLAVVGAVLLDLVKTIFSHDPYFWGLTDLPPPDYFPFSLVRASFLLTRVYRLVVSMVIMWMGLRTVYTLAPLIFVGVIGREWLGANGEAWMYPDHFGGYASVLDRGLAGWWGGWWHQMFRFAFQDGGRWTADLLQLERGSFLGTVVQPVVVFTLSGLLHASGSQTMIGDTDPWRGSFLFFLLQPVGILLEMGWKDLLRRTGLQDRIPSWLSRSGNFVFVHVWFFATAPMLIDEFAKGGILHFEPIIFSPLRGLGFGTEGDGFVCIEGRLARWHSDTRWWVRGVAL